MLVEQPRLPRPPITARLRKLYYPDLPPLKSLMAVPSPQPATISTGSYVPATTPPRTETSSDVTSRPLDLEKELTCSICTEILYRPLTLLDCLHTFCAGCVKEWFKWQGLSAAEKHSRDRGHSSHNPLSNPYTCPSCRASVRETRPSATVTSLLEMYLSANPAKGRTVMERLEADRQYTRGENVLPDVRTLSGTAGRMGSGSPAEMNSGMGERRLVQDVRDMGLSDRALRRRQGTEESSGEEPRRARQGSNNDSGHSRNSRATQAQDQAHRQRRRDRSEQSRQRILEHQNSLRSLLGVGDVDSQGLEEEIMRQITAAGLLDGIDTNNMDVSQEDELTERIVLAFRERQRTRQQERRSESARRRVETQERPPESQNRRPDTERRRADSEARGQAGQRRRTSTNPTQTHPDTAVHIREHVHERQSRPPVSRPQLLEAASSSGRPERRERRSSSQDNTTRARPSDVRTTGAEWRVPEAISSSTSDLPTRAESRDRAQDHRLRAVSRERRATNPETRNVSDSWRAAGGSPAAQLANSQTGTVVVAHARTTAPRRATQPSLQQHIASEGNPAPSATSPTGDNSTTISQYPIENTRLDPEPTSPMRSPVYTPIISCDNCRKQGIEHTVHYICRKCPSQDENSPYTLCIQCYRRGKGCRHWFGFGHAAGARFRKLAPPTGWPRGTDPPHVMLAQQYISSNVITTHHLNRTRAEATTVPEQGKFCDICFRNANDCYWQCDSCNDGEWGFCNVCVKQAKHCNHPLLACSVSPISNSGGNGQQPPRSFPSTISHTVKPLAIHTQCANCLKHILYTQARFHCPTCNFGDYDLCTPCYNSMVTAGQISIRNGPQGWRRCPQGHRMLVIGFDDSKPDRRRVILEGIVGGWALHEGDDASSPVSSTNSPHAQPQTVTNRPASRDQDASERAKTPPSLQRWSWRDPDTGGGWKHKKRGRRPSSSDSNDGATPSAATAKANAAMLKDIPPSGGSGMKMLALWSRVSEEGVEDELEFPRGAVVEEVVDINGDWCWGVYCRRTGLFPGGWARLL